MDMDMDIDELINAYFATSDGNDESAESSCSTKRKASKMDWSQYTDPARIRRQEDAEAARRERENAPVPGIDVEESHILVYIERVQGPPSQSRRKNRNAASVRNEAKFTPTPSQIRRFLENNPDKPIEIEITDWASIHDELFPGDPGKKEEIFMQYFDVFLDYVPRWKSIQVWTPWVPRGSFEKHNGSFPTPTLLEVVHLYGPGDSQTDDLLTTARFMFPCWKNAPRLRKVVVQYKGNNDEFQLWRSPLTYNPHIYLPLQTLKRLNFNIPLSPFECCQILHHAVNLIECNLSYIAGAALCKWPAPTPPPGEQLWRNNSLKRLQLANNDVEFLHGEESYLWQILENFAAPSLRDLTVTSDHQWRTTSFLSFLKHSGCTLEALQLTHVKLNEQELVVILSHLPHLRALNVLNLPDSDKNPLTERVLYLLARKANEITLCQDLEMVSFHMDMLEGKDAELLLFLHSRAGPRLDRFRKRKGEKNLYQIVPRKIGATIDTIWISTDDSEDPHPQHYADMLKLGSIQNIRGRSTNLIEKSLIGDSHEHLQEWEGIIEQKLQIWGSAVSDSNQGVETTLRERLSAISLEQSLHTTNATIDKHPSVQNNPSPSGSFIRWHPRGFGQDDTQKTWLSV